MENDSPFVTLETKKQLQGGAFTDEQAEGLVTALKFRMIAGVATATGLILSAIGIAVTVLKKITVLRHEQDSHPARVLGISPRA